MLATLQETLGGLSKTTKRVILNLTMLVLLGLGLLFIFLSTRQAPNSEGGNPYGEYLDQYQQEYLEEQPGYRQFAFYETYDELIFTEKQLD
jgi:hypothetical protein